MSSIVSQLDRIDSRLEAIEKELFGAVKSIRRRSRSRSPVRRKRSRSSSPTKRMDTFRPCNDIYISNFRAMNVNEDQFIQWVKEHTGITVKKISFSPRPTCESARICLNSIQDQDDFLTYAGAIQEAFQFKDIRRYRSN